MARHVDKALAWDTVIKRSTEVNRLRDELAAIVDMVVNCADAPRNADSLVQMIRARAEAALPKKQG